MQGTEPARVRIGLFELDLKTGELCGLNGASTNGGPTLLPEQPFRILRMLIQHEGKLVTRDEIQQKLWPDDTVVEFGHSINVAVGTLRRALGDSATKPKYIETVARRGYRLMVPVAPVDPNGNAAAAQSVGETIDEPAKARSWIWLALGLLVVGVALIGWAHWRWQLRVRLTEADTVVLGDVANETTDPVFDSLNVATRIGLEQTPFLSLLTPDKVEGAVEQMNRPADTKLSPAVTREICLHTRSDAFITGSVADAGNRFRIVLKAFDCRTARTIAEAEAQSGERSEVIRTLGLTITQLRRNLGEAKQSLAEFNQPLEKATSSSLEALQAFSKAQKLAGSAASLEHCKRAVQLDPEFALAHAYLGAAAFNQGEFRLATDSVSRAFALRDRLTERSSLFVDALYYDIATGEIDKANKIYARWVQIFPRDYLAHTDYGVSLTYIGQFERAIEPARVGTRLYPSWLNYLNVFRPYLFLNRFEEAEGVLDEARGRVGDNWLIHYARYSLALAQRDLATMDRELTLVREGRDAEGRTWALQQRADTSVWLGKFNAAEQFYLALPHHQPGASGILADRALRHLETGNAKLAAEEARKAADANPDTRSKGAIALVFARIGDADRANALISELNRDYPLNTMMQSYVLPTLRAALCLGRNDGTRALALLEATRPYELGNTPSFNWMYPVYVRGLVYMQLGRSTEAAAEFQNIANHPGFMQDALLGPLADLQLGRAQAMAGEKAAARKSYQDFLTLWKDADPDIPIYQQAKAEYARLQ